MIGQPTLDLIGLPEPDHDHRLIGRCPVKSCGFTRATRESGLSMAPVCASHGRALRWQRIEGTHRPGIRCDARCQYAKGPDCECSCAGANHGRGWMA
jgi:hypothetical protein